LTKILTKTYDDSRSVHKTYLWNDGPKNYEPFLIFQKSIY